jgi:DNA polymerase-3 subunit beta
MELVVRKADLLRELQLFQGIVERKNTIPILANILMEAGSGELRFLATDLEVGLRSRCEASVSRQGAVTVPAKKFFEIVRALPETDIHIAEERGGVKVAADHFDSRLPAEPSENFPTLPQRGDGAAVMLPRAILRDMIVRTQFAIALEDSRYYLNGAQLVLKPEVMTLVATDGHRLAIVTAPIGAENGRREPSMVILPRKTLAELGRLLGEGEGDVIFQPGENHLFFEIGGRTLISRIIDAQYPSYERVIPKANDKRIEFERDRLASAVRRVALVSNERSRAVRLQIDKGKVEIASSSQEFGEAHEELRADYDGGALQISFNAQYVLDFLSVVGTDVVTLELKDEMSQALMKPVGAEGYDYLYVVMPMRT